VLPHLRKKAQYFESRCSFEVKKLGIAIGVNAQKENTPPMGILVKDFEEGVKCR
jgi:hypothetical protein